ncbi:MAG: hypothetical protein ACRD1Z_15425 [Vicinamibacteria bacterium]
MSKLSLPLLGLALFVSACTGSLEYSNLSPVEKNLYKAYFPHMTPAQRSAYLELPDAEAREKYSKEIGVHTVVHKEGATAPPPVAPPPEARPEDRKPLPAYESPDEELKATLDCVEPPPTALDALRLLNKMYEEKLITEDEFKKKRKDTLDRL